MTPFQDPTKFTFVTLENKDEALRIILYLLISNVGYKSLPLLQIHTFYQSILHNNYILMIDDNKAIAVMMWMWVSAEVKEDCLKNDRDALISELASKGDAIYCTAFTSIRPGKLLPLFKFFSKMYYDSDILFKKHFKRGKRESIPIMLVRRQRRVKAVSNRR